MESIGTRKRGRTTVTTVTTKTPKRARTVVVPRNLLRVGGYTGRFGKNGELKFFDTAISFTIDATGEVPATGQLNLIPQGDTESTRVGRKCTVKSIEWWLNMQYNPSAANVEDLTKIAIVQDKQANGAAATAALVYTSTNLPTAPRNLENEPRFRVLKEIVQVWNAQAGVAGAYAPVQKYVHGRKKVNIPLIFDSTATTGAIGTIRTNNIFLLAGTGGSSDDLVNVNGNVRIRYTDD